MIVIHDKIVIHRRIVIHDMIVIHRMIVVHNAEAAASLLFRSGGCGMKALEERFYQ